MEKWTYVAVVYDKKWNTVMFYILPDQVYQCLLHDEDQWPALKRFIEEDRPRSFDNITQLCIDVEYHGHKVRGFINAERRYD